MSLEDRVKDSPWTEIQSPGIPQQMPVSYLGRQPPPSYTSAGTYMVVRWCALSAHGPPDALFIQHTHFRMCVWVTSLWVTSPGPCITPVWDGAGSDRDVTRSDVITSGFTAKLVHNSVGRQGRDVTVRPRHRVVFKCPAWTNTGVIWAVTCGISRYRLSTIYHVIIQEEVGIVGIPSMIYATTWFGITAVKWHTMDIWFTMIYNSYLAWFNINGIQ